MSAKISRYIQQTPPRESRSRSKPKSKPRPSSAGKHEF